jgi:hypothetical protein
MPPSFSPGDPGSPPSNTPEEGTSSSESAAACNDGTKKTCTTGRLMMPSTLETIDMGFYNHINDVFDISATTNEGWKKVPVIWVGAERAFQVKNDLRLRTTDGQIILPVITIEKTSMVKDPTFKGAVQADVLNLLKDPRAYRGGGLPVARSINQEKTRNFAQADQDRRWGGNDTVEKKFTKTNKKIVYNTVYMPIPTYLNITYSITLRTEYQQQMNNMLTPFITRTGQINSFSFTHDGHRFEAFIQQDFSQSNNLSNLGEEERMFMTKVDIKVLGYLMGEADNNAEPKSTVKENIVEIRTIRERTIVGDEKPWETDNKKYRQ